MENKLQRGRHLGKESKSEEHFRSIAVAQCNLLQDKAVDVEKRAQSQR